MLFISTSGIYLNESYLAPNAFFEMLYLCTRKARKSDGDVIYDLWECLLRLMEIIPMGVWEISARATEDIRTSKRRYPDDTKITKPISMFNF